MHRSDIPEECLHTKCRLHIARRTRSVTHGVTGIELCALGFSGAPNGPGENGERSLCMCCSQSYLSFWHHIALAAQVQDRTQPFRTGLVERHLVSLD